MDNEILMALATLGVVWLAILVLRVPSAIALLAVLVGQILSQELSVNIFSPAVSDAILLGLPLVVTLFILRGKVSKSKLLIELLPSLGVSVMSVILLSKLFEPLEKGVQTLANGHLSDYEPWAMVGVPVLVLGVYLLKNTKRHEGKHKHK